MIVIPKSDHHPVKGVSDNPFRLLLLAVENSLVFVLGKEPLNRLIISCIAGFPERGWLIGMIAFRRAGVKDRLTLGGDESLVGAIITITCQWRCFTQQIGLMQKPVAGQYHV